MIDGRRRHPRSSSCPFTCWFLSVIEEGVCAFRTSLAQIGQW